MTAATTQGKRKVNADTAHGLLGHMNDTDARQAIKNVGYELVKKRLTPCGACAETKSKQRSLLNRMATISVEVKPRELVKTVNKLVHNDISSVKKPQESEVNITKPH